MSANRLTVGATTSDATPAGGSPAAGTVAHTGPPHGHLPLTGAPLVVETTAALGLMVTAVMAAVVARRRPRTRRPHLDAAE